MVFFFCSYVIFIVLRYPAFHVCDRGDDKHEIVRLLAAAQQFQGSLRGLYGKETNQISRPTCILGDWPSLLVLHCYWMQARIDRDNVKVIVLFSSVSACFASMSFAQGIGNKDGRRQKMCHFLDTLAEFNFFGRGCFWYLLNSFDIYWLMQGYAWYDAHVCTPHHKNSQKTPDNKCRSWSCCDMCRRAKSVLWPESPQAEHAPFLSMVILSRMDIALKSGA